MCEYSFWGEYRLTGPWRSFLLMSKYAFVVDLKMCVCVLKTLVTAFVVSVYELFCLLYLKIEILLCVVVVVVLFW